MTTTMLYKVDFCQIGFQVQTHTLSNLLSQKFGLISEYFVLVLEYGVKKSDLIFFTSESFNISIEKSELHNFLALSIRCRLLCSLDNRYSRILLQLIMVSCALSMLESPEMHVNLYVIFLFFSFLF